jgi:negative regulator of flagellin synthesis FlgM
MVDPVGLKASVAAARPVAPVAPVSTVQAPQVTAQTAQVRADPSTLQALSQPLAAQPPVDAERVSKIKKAIADGNFPLVPSTVADRLLALKLEWNPNEPS